MICRKCKKEAPEGALFCPWCGKSTAEPKRRPKSRANGTGTAIRRGKTWTAVVVDGFHPSADGTYKLPNYKTKGGFKTRKEALNFCPQLKTMKKPSEEMKLSDVYALWVPFYSHRVKSMANYTAAYAHFGQLHGRLMKDITAADLQACMDACKAGKRTHQVMKVTAGLLWGYAKDSGWISQNITENLYTGKGKSIQREPLTESEIQTIRDAIGIHRYADYVFCLCYLGFRPGEFLSLRKDHYKILDGVEVLVNGSKTDAGRDRVVVIPPQILDIVRARLWVPGTDLIFPQYLFDHKGEKLKKLKPMSDAYFREITFKPLMKKLGIAEGKVPYSARHSYSDKLKRAEGSEKAKAGLMGHTDYAFTQSHYQSTDMDDLLEIALSIE